MSHCSLTINISQNYQLQCIITDENDKDHIIKLHNQPDDQETCPAAIDKNDPNYDPDEDEKKDEK